MVPHFYVQTTNIKANDEFGNKLRITTAFNTSNRLKNELVQSVLLKISNLTNSTTHSEQLYASIYQAITELIPIRNFAVCVKNKITNEIELPFVRNDKHLDDNSSVLAEHKYVEKIGKTVKLKEDNILGLIKNQDLKVYELIPSLILGIPLRARDEVLGSLIIKDYLEAGFTTEEIELLELVAGQVTRVVERKNYEDELIRSKEQSRRC